MFKTITEQQIDNLRTRFSEHEFADYFCKRAGIKLSVLYQIISGKLRRVNGELYSILFPFNSYDYSSGRLSLIISGIESKKVKSAESKPEEHHDFTRKVLDIIMRAEIPPEQKITLYNEISSL